MADISATFHEGEEKKIASWKFWAIFPGLCLTTILIALESTILATALPTIVSELHSSSLSVWAINAYTLTFTAVQPLFGQCADFFGRKPTLMTALSLFLVGSGVCGAAKNTAMLVAGRAVQGLGGGGLSILPALVVCDLVALKERAKYQIIILGSFSLGMFVGPVVGGLMVDHIGWRWVFWFNLPIAGTAMALVGVFMRVKHNRSASVIKLLRQLDYFGNLWLTASVTSILLALSTASGPGSWTSWKTLVPLLLGFAGLPAFIFFEASKLWCPNPTVPIRLFKNSTSVLGFCMSFLNGVLVYWAIYFLPIYFQAVKQNSAQQTGINTLPLLVPIVPFGIVGSFIIATKKRYKPNQIAGFTLAGIGLGCFSVLDRNSPIAVWVVLQLVFASGGGLVISSTLTTIQAPLPESDVAVSTGVWGFTQGLGFICGMAFPTSIFESRFRDLLPSIGDVLVRDGLRADGAYEHASKQFVGSLQGVVQEQVITAFEASLKLVWEVGVTFAVLGFIAAMVIKEVVIRETLETQYGIDESLDDTKTKVDVEKATVRPS